MVSHRTMLAAVLLGASLGLGANLLGAGTPWVGPVVTHLAQPAGQLFLRLLFMLVVPLLFSALVLGLCDLDLAALGVHAVPGARVLWLGVAPEAVARYRRAGLLRADLSDALDAAGADLAVVARTAGSRDAEYAAWEALGSARAEAGAYLDDVPLAQVFARPGAWR